jgi:hypothetical protein
MRLGTAGWLVAGFVMVMAQSALASNLSISLKNYYAEYEVVLQCQLDDKLSADDADAAKTAMGKIETYYLKRDSKLNKDRLLKLAIADKNEGFRIMARSGNDGLRAYCRQSLHDLLTKADDISQVASGR